MKYGYFDNDNYEYIITNPKTPVKWINYIGTINFGGFVDHTGGALLCKGDPAVNRISRYITIMPSSDFKGETLYIRIKNGEGYKIFSPFFVPTLDNYDLYECHIGLGYTKIISEFYGIRCEAKIFVPVNGEREIRDIVITNLNSDILDIDVIPVVEYTHFDALKQLTNADWVPQTMQSDLFEDAFGNKVITQYAFMNKKSRINYFTSNYEISSFETDRPKFLGDNEYGTYKNPLSLYNYELSNYEARRGDNIAALMHHLKNVKSGESKRIIVQLGQCSNIKDEFSSIDYYRNEKNVDLEFNKLKSSWNEYLDKQQFETPDESMNTMINIHNPRQCYITKNWSRYLSLYQLGYGSRGIGVRDSCQDVMGVLYSKPNEGRKLLEMLINVQKNDGSSMHQLNPVTLVATVGDASEKEDRPQYYGDDHLWLILSVCSYLKESGDFDFLSKVIPFYDKNKDGIAIDNGTVLEHLKRAVEFTEKNKGAHNLPLLGFADWNDTVNLPKGAESVFIADLYGRALLDMIELLEVINDNKLADTYKSYYKNMKETVNKYAWDGEWYARYFDHEGNVMGSNLNTYGKIYINAQSWALMSEFATKEYADKCLESVYKILNTKNGLKLSYPGFNEYDEVKGGITTYPPGAKENGGIFLHCNPWMMIAETLNGNGDRAFKYYNQINPVNKNDNIDNYECEPYCYPQNILGDEHPLFGLARNSWLSGTSSWVYQAATQYILGIKPEYSGLKINPCIPKAWDGFNAVRYFRNAKYKINVTNPNNVCKGVSKVTSDGIEISGNIIPIYNDGKTHEISVIMG